MPQPERPPVTLAERYAGWRWPDRLAAVPTQHAARGDDEDGWAPSVPRAPRALPCPGPRGGRRRAHGPWPPDGGRRRPGGLGRA